LRQNAITACTPPHMNLTRSGVVHCCPSLAGGWGPPNALGWSMASPGSLVEGRPPLRNARRTTSTISSWRMVTDTHPVNVQAEQERRFSHRNRRQPGEWWNATANRDSDQAPTSEDGTALLTSDEDSATPLNYMEAISSSEADEWRKEPARMSSSPSCSTRSGR
jgi:hypothetical protein